MKIAQRTDIPRKSQTRRTTVQPRVPSMSQSSVPKIFSITRRVHNLAIFASSEGMIMITVITMRSAGDLVAVSVCSCVMLYFFNVKAFFLLTAAPPLEGIFSVLHQGNPRVKTVYSIGCDGKFTVEVPSLVLSLIVSNFLVRA